MRLAASPNDRERTTGCGCSYSGCLRHTEQHDGIGQVNPFRRGATDVAVLLGCGLLAALWQRVDSMSETGVINTPDHRLRVFVSSTLEELAAERQAVRTR